MVALAPAVAEAAPCDCDHVIDVAVQTADGAQMGVMPGQSVCVEGGERPFLRLSKFKGAEGSPIEIRNCEGLVEIDNDDKGYGLTVEESNFVRVTGTGDERFEYGFKVRASKDGPDYSAMGVSITNLSSDVEADHLEVYESGFAGFNVKTEPRCDLSANLGEFVMYNVSLHHNYIHDTIGEGIYFGSTGYGGREYDCDGQKVILYPHEHHGADIHDNVIENTGWDGAQIGVTPVGCKFHHNTIRNVGLGGVQYQQQGLQIGGASSCEIYANVLMDGPTNGIFVFGADDTLVYNNLVVGFQESGIYSNDQGLKLDARYRFAFNTVIESGGFGLAVFGKDLGPGWAYSNVIAGAGEGLLAIGGDVPMFEEMGNHTADTPDGFGFVDVAARDFHLLETSMLRDVGVLPPGLELAEDLDGKARSDGEPDAGAFEFGVDEPDPGTTSDTATGGDDSAGDTGGEPGTASDTGNGEGGPETSGGPDDPTGGPDDPTGAPTSEGGTSEGGTSEGATGGESSEGGCGCRSAPAGSSAWLALLLLVRRRRRG